MKSILKMPAWQIFIITLILPLLFQFALPAVFLFSSVEVTMIYMMSIILFQVLMILTWIISIGIGLLKKIPKIPSLNKTYFIFNSTYILGYIIFFILFAAYMVHSMFIGIDVDPSALLVILPFHLYGMICVIYITFFIGKSVVSVEKKKEAIYSEYLEIILMIIFFPVGVWLLQPRINKIFK